MFLSLYCAVYNLKKNHLQFTNVTYHKLKILTDIDARINFTCRKSSINSQSRKSFLSQEIT